MLHPAHLFFGFTGIQETGGNRTRGTNGLTHHTVSRSGSPHPTPTNATRPVPFYSLPEPLSEQQSVMTTATPHITQQRQCQSLSERALFSPSPSFFPSLSHMTTGWLYCAFSQLTAISCDIKTPCIAQHFSFDAPFHALFSTSHTRCSLILHDRDARLSCKFPSCCTK